MFKIHIIESGYFKADGGAMFGAIPKRAWQRKYPCDDNNLCTLAMRCVLAVSDNRRILVDLGIGARNIGRMSYFQPSGVDDISEAIGKFGFVTDDITDVVLSHLHFDHCGNAVCGDNGALAPTFGKARYWVSEKQWLNLLNPNPLEKHSFLTEDIIMPVYEAGMLHVVTESRLRLYDGFEVGLFDGHSDGQIATYISTRDGIVCTPGDLIPTSAHVALEWISAADISAITSYGEKERFLEEVADNNYTLIYYHDCHTVAGKVKRMNNNFIPINEKLYNK